MNIIDVTVSVMDVIQSIISYKEGRVIFYLWNGDRRKGGSRVRTYWAACCVRPLDANINLVAFGTTTVCSLNSRCPKADVAQRKLKIKKELSTFRFSVLTGLHFSVA